MENRSDTCNSPSSLSTSSSDSGDQTLDLGISLQGKGRQLSVESEKSLNQLEDLKQAYESLMTEAKDIEKNTDIENYKAVSKAKNRLAQITGSIEKLQFNKLDAVSTVHLNSGKAEVRSNRRELNTALDELQEFTSSLHTKYDAVTQLESSVCSSNTDSISSDSDNDDASDEVMKDIDGTTSPHTVSDLEVSDDEDEDIDFCDDFDQHDDVSASEEGSEKASDSPVLQAQVRFVEPVEHEEKKEEQEELEQEEFYEEEELEEDDVDVDNNEEQANQQREEEQATTSTILEEDEACDCLHCSLSAAKFLSPSWHSSVQALSRVKALAEAAVAALPQPSVEVTENLSSTLAQEEPVQKKAQEETKQEKKQEETSSAKPLKPLDSCECGHCRLAAAGWWTPQGVMHARALAQANAKAEAEAEAKSNIKDRVKPTTPAEEKKNDKREEKKEAGTEQDNKQVKSCGCGHCRLAAAGFWTPQALMHARVRAQANASTRAKTEEAGRVEAQKKAEAMKIHHERQLLVQQAQEMERRRQMQLYQQHVALEPHRQRQYHAQQQRLQQERQYQQQLLQRQLRQQQLQQQQMYFLGHPRRHAPDRFLGGLFGM